jgi:NAD(P)-dependent dehydrogenase (short-subunit alcohol dehydrogenase family)
MRKVWFITGSSRGSGRELVRAALDNGDAVAATARRPEQLANLTTAYGELSKVHPPRPAVCTACNSASIIDIRATRA